MACRGIRGAVCAKANEADAIVAATRDLLEHIVADNDVAVEDVACIIFTATPDLDTGYPARAAREMGWTTTPLLCEQEMVVTGMLPLCIRVLMLWNTDRTPGQIHHVYLGEARSLRPDLAEEEDND
jgi:chorismate mutase